MTKLNTQKKLLILAIASATYAGSAHAITVDGVVDPVNEYAAGVTINLGFASDDSDVVDFIEGTFYWAIENGVIYAALSAPTDYTDNVYGALSQGVGWDKGRGFDKLLGSDRLLFGLDTNNDGSNDVSVVIDYLAKEIGGNFDQKESKLDLKGSDKGIAPNSTIINSKDNVYIQGNDGGPDPYRAVFGVTNGSVIQDVATSLEYNLSKGCGDTSDSPDFADASLNLDVGCSAILTYEWSMDASAFTNFSALSILAPLMHSSPSKLGKGGSVFEPCLNGNGNGNGNGRIVVGPHLKLLNPVV